MEMLSEQVELLKRKNPDPRAVIKSNNMLSVLKKNFCLVEMNRKDYSFLLRVPYQARLQLTRNEVFHSKIRKLRFRKLKKRMITRVHQFLGLLKIAIIKIRE